jgi:hypothetical protein
MQSLDRTREQGVLRQTSRLLAAWWIEAAVHIRRETIGGYLRAAGIPVRQPGGWGRLAPAKPANEVITDFGARLDQCPGSDCLLAGFQMIIVGRF